MSRRSGAKEKTRCRPLIQRAGLLSLKIGRQGLIRFREGTGGEEDMKVIREKLG